MPDITAAVVVFHTDPSLLTHCFSSIRAAAVAAQLDVEILVVDNSLDDSLDPFESLADRWLRTESNVGFGVAANLATTMAASEHVLLLNPDAAVSGAALREMWENAGLVQDALFCGWLAKDGLTQVDAFMVWWTSSGRLLRRGRYRKRLDRLGATHRRVPVQKVSGGALFGRKEVLVSFGPFDERFFLYGEDVDLSIRARKAGFGLYALPRAQVEHIGASSQQEYSALVETARADAAIRVNSYHLPYPVALASRVEFAAVSLVGLLPGLGTTSGSAQVRWVRFNQIIRWGLWKDRPAYRPQSASD